MQCNTLTSTGSYIETNVSPETLNTQGATKKI
ncbi:hypothetical protein Riv7116_6947 (plasmid) [Rivularia sp. PCC 7116]|nr:hypothetical protein Riv7116_6947 [Rivularia sp. PCC 7116]